MKRSLLITAVLAGLLLNSANSEAEENSGKFFGRIYFHYFHDFSNPEVALNNDYGSLNGVTLTRPGQDNGFTFSRFYFGYDRDLNEKMGIRFLLDMDNTADAGGKKAWRPFLKNAYFSMKCKLIEGSTWYVGMIGMPFVSTPESQFGYRSIAVLGMDMAGWGSTADLGIGWKNTWNDMLQVEFALANGGGYKNPEGDMFKLVELRPTLYLMEKDLTLSAFGSYESINDSSNAMILSGMAGYDHEFFRVGAEYSMRSLSKTAWNAISASAEDLTQSIISGWVHVKPTDKVSLLGRYDIYDPDTDQDNDALSYVIVGLDFHPNKNFRIIPNIQMQMTELADDSSTPGIDESAPRSIAFVTFEASW